MGRWYWFWCVCIGLAGAHMVDHLVAAAFNTTPISDVVVGNQLDAAGFTLWHGINSITDYVSLVLVAVLLVGRPTPPQPRWGVRGWLWAFRGNLGRWFWPFTASFAVVSFHTSDHIQAILFTNTLLSDTFFANSVSHEGFLAWHAVNTVLAFFLLVLLTYLLALKSPVPRVPGTRPAAVPRATRNLGLSPQRPSARTTAAVEQEERVLAQPVPGESPR